MTCIQCSNSGEEEVWVCSDDDPEEHCPDSILEKALTVGGSRCETYDAGSYHIWFKPGNPCETYLGDDKPDPWKDLGEVTLPSVPDKDVYRICCTTGRPPPGGGKSPFIVSIKGPFESGDDCESADCPDVR